MNIRYFNLIVGIWITIQGAMELSSSNFSSFSGIVLLFMGLLNLAIGFGGLDLLFEKLHPKANNTLNEDLNKDETLNDRNHFDL